MPHYQLVRALGMIVVPVEELPRGALLMEHHDVALIRADLTEDQHAQVADWLLDQALGRSLARPR